MFSKPCFDCGKRIGGIERHFDGKELARHFGKYVDKQIFFLGEVYAFKDQRADF